MAQFISECSRVMRYRHLSYRSEQSYLAWIERFVRHCKQKPQNLQSHHARRFLTFLANERGVSAKTQNVAFSAILFLFRHVLQKELDVINVQRARESRHLPVVLSPGEVRRLLSHTKGAHGLICSLIYGTGLRVNEALRLRVKDIDFDGGRVMVFGGKGDKDRVTMLPKTLVAPLRAHLELLRHEGQSAPDVPVYIPDSLARKYPGAGLSWEWQYLWPVAPAVDPLDGQIKRHHVKDYSIQRAVKIAARKAGIEKTVSPHALRHSFAKHLVDSGVDIRKIQQLLGHESISTTMIYTRLEPAEGAGVKSPLDD